MLLLVFIVVVLLVVTVGLVLCATYRAAVQKAVIASLFLPHENLLSAEVVVYAASRETQHTRQH